MKVKRIMQFALIGFVSMIVIGVLGMLVWAKTGTYPARAVALSALESTDRVTITQDEWIVFAPGEETETGLVFYPGGLVEPTAYSPILRKIAEEGGTPRYHLHVFNLGNIGYRCCRRSSCATKGQVLRSSKQRSQWQTAVLSGMPIWI
jgi:hypothetical protein